jgi:hypothetical protein
MKLTEKLNALLEVLTDLDYDIISSLLSNDELSTDGELFDLIDSETDTKMDKKSLTLLIKKERDNFTNFKYKSDKKSIEVIKGYLS